jgi:hypothetical protein
MRHPRCRRLGLAQQALQRRGDLGLQVLLQHFALARIEDGTALFELGGQGPFQQVGLGCEPLEMCAE